MGKIFFLSGKSSTGKDTIYKRLLADESLKLRSVTMYTTRPKREGETDGFEYHFVDQETADFHKTDGHMIEFRVYNTVHGPWMYYTRDDGQIDLSGEDNYLAIGTMEAYAGYIKYFGADNVVPIYIEVDDGIRLGRALEREKKQAVPNYREMCRRYIADDDDFAEEVLSKRGITRRFRNDDLDGCISEISEYITEKKL